MPFRQVQIVIDHIKWEKESGEYLHINQTYVCRYLKSSLLSCVFIETFCPLNVPHHTKFSVPLFSNNNMCV